MFLHCCCHISLFHEGALNKRLVLLLLLCGIRHTSQKCDETLCGDMTMLVKQFLCSEKCSPVSLACNYVQKNNDDLCCIFFKNKLLIIIKWNWRHGEKHIKKKQIPVLPWQKLKSSCPNWARTTTKRIIIESIWLTFDSLESIGCTLLTIMKNNEALNQKVSGVRATNCTNGHYVLMLNIWQQFTLHIVHCIPYILD